jgi:histidinol-phosphatase
MSRLTAREFQSLVPVVAKFMRQSDAIVLQHLNRARVSRKPDGSDVTVADKAAERLLRRLLREQWPADTVLGEEYGGRIARRGRSWLVDPIDGTASYALGMPMFGSLLSLLIDGEPVFGCIHLPALRESTFAGIGHGCWHVREGGRARRVHVGPPRRLAEAKVGVTTVKEHAWLDREGGNAAMTLACKVGRLRMVGDCVQYALLCRGVLDAAVDPFMAPWDVAAIVPCILEAGGSISDLGGRASRILERSSIVAASSARLRREICRAASDSSPAAQV